MRKINEANNKQTLRRPLGSHRNEVQLAAQCWRFPTAHLEEWLPSASSHAAAAPRGHFSTMAKPPQLRKSYATSRSGSPRASRCMTLRCSFTRKNTVHTHAFCILSPCESATGHSWRQTTGIISQVSYSYQM